MIIDSNLIAINLTETDSQGVIRMLGKLLYDAGHVKESFIPGVIDREREFPTGICLETMNVALPHTDCVHVNHSSLAVGVLADPVPFHVMGSPQDEIRVKLVLLMAIKDPDEQISTLRELAQMLQLPDVMAEIASAGGEDEIARTLIQNLSNHDSEHE